MQEDIQCKTIAELYSGEKSDEKEIRFFFDKTQEEEISRIFKLSQSWLFSLYWDREFNEQDIAGDESLQASDVLEKIWISVEEELRSLLEDLASEEITLRHVDALFKEYRNKTDLLCEEIALLDCVINGSEQSEWILLVVEKINQFFKLQDCQSNARNILQVGKMLNLKGDFTAFEGIVQQVCIF